MHPPPTLLSTNNLHHCKISQSLSHQTIPNLLKNHVSYANVNWSTHYTHTPNQPIYTPIHLRTHSPTHPLTHPHTDPPTNPHSNRPTHTPNHTPTYSRTEQLTTPPLPTDIITPRIARIDSVVFCFQKYLISRRNLSHVSGIRRGQNCSFSKTQQTRI